ncbi:MAG: hypothetical protein M3Z00_10890 [Actinomycetota bacterium]|nr:hypothetical protein [Actinomycetota bacterium]
MVALEIVRSSTMWLPALEAAAGGAVTDGDAPVEPTATGVDSTGFEAMVVGAAIDDPTEVSVAAGGEVPRLGAVAEWTDEVWEAALSPAAVLPLDRAAIGDRVGDGVTFDAALGAAALGAAVVGAGVLGAAVVGAGVLGAAVLGEATVEEVALGGTDVGNALLLGADGEAAAEFDVGALTSLLVIGCAVPPALLQLASVIVKPATATSSRATRR